MYNYIEEMKKQTADMQAVLIFKNDIRLLVKNVNFVI